MKARPALSPFIIPVALILFFAACVQSGAGDSPGNIILQLKWRHQFQFAGYYAAVEKGFYRDAGLEVALREGAPEINPSEEVLAGRAQYGVSDPVLIIERNQGRPLVVLAAVFQHSPLALFSLKQSGISTPHDLVGRRVWMRPALEAGLVVMLRNEGVSPDKISVPASFQDVSDLIEGRVDAIAGYVTDRPFELEKRGMPYCIIHPQTYGIDFYGDCLFSSERELRKNPKRVCAFLSATMEGWEYAMQHQAEMADIILRKYPGHRTREQLLFEAGAMEKLIMPEFIELGHINPGRWRHIGDVYVRAGMLRPDYSMEGLLYDPKAQRYSAVLRQAAYAAGCITALALLGLCIIFLFNKRLKTRVAQSTTELEQAIHMLRESQERFRAIAENLPEAIITTDSAAMILYCNAAAGQMFRYAQDELIGKPSSILVPGRLTAIEAAHRGDYARTGETDFMGSAMESCGARKDGTEFPIEFSVFRWNIDGDFFYGTITRDITRRKQAENEIRQARDYLENLFKTSPDAIIITDGEGYIRRVNEAVYNLYGYHPEELIGQHASVLTPPDEKALQTSVELMEELFEKGNVRGFPAERVHKDGRRIQVESSVMLVKNPDGTVSGAFSSSRDTTDRKRLEEQLRQSQKMEAIGTLAGGIAHDFNNILGIILGYAELSYNLAAGNSALERNLAQILKAAERARDLVRQILAFSRKGESDVKPLHMHLIIRECLKLLRASLPSTIDISMDIDEADDIVVADPTEIHQIIMNLCTNAAHAMDQTGGHLEIRLNALDIDAHSVLPYSGLEPGPHVLLSVRDTGPGIPADIIGRVFEPFFTTKGAGRGTGMGLSVAHGIVKRLKGDIRACSEPGRGAVFHVVLPRVREPLPQSRAEAQAPPRGHEPVLLVDDEQVLLDVGTQMLEALGYRVTAVRSPLEAWELFKKNPAAFDLVITDQTMPGLTGYELGQKLLELRKDIPVILCTGYSDLVTAESALAAGIKAFVIKPMNLLTLAETIRRALDKSAA